MKAAEGMPGVRVAVMGVLLAGCASAGSSAPAAAPSLTSAFTVVSLPQGTVRLTPGAHASPLPIGHAGGSRVSYEDWSSPISMNATMAWITEHMPTGWLPGDLDKYNLGRLQEWDGPAGPATDGPNLTVTVTAAGKGAVVEIAAWTMPFGAKSAKETVSAVTAATAHVSNDNGSSVTPFTVALTLAQAQRFAAEINALAVEHPEPWTGFAGMPNVTLTFQTPAGARSFLARRNDYDVQSLGGGPDLIMSGSLQHELDLDIPKGQPARPATDKHPVLPQHITSALLVTGLDKGLLVPSPVLTGSRLRQLVADLRNLTRAPEPVTCTKQNQPNGRLDVRGSTGVRKFLYEGDCDQLTPETEPDGVIPVPFHTAPAFEADIARLLAETAPVKGVGPG